MTNQTITKTESWRSRIKEQQASGISQAKYCFAHAIAINTFLYWKRKLSVDSAQSFVKVARPRSRKKKLAIIHPDGVRVILEPEAPEGLANALLAAMREI
jgi:hypothetical protein